MRPPAPAPAAAAVAKSDKSIAVLPFVNMSDDKDYFADGITEEILNALASVNKLKVAGRTSSFAFKGENDDLRRIGEALGVDHILEGSVRRSGDKVRITAQLIHVADGFHLWSETYDRELDDVFQVQDDISAAVVQRLKLQLLGPAAATDPVHPEAYTLFLRARHLNRLTAPKAYLQSEAALKRALELEPGYAAAWSKRRGVYLGQANVNRRPMQEGYRLAREALGKALAIDPQFAPGPCRAWLARVGRGRRCASGGKAPVPRIATCARRSGRAQRQRRPGAEYRPHELPISTLEELVSPGSCQSLRPRHPGPCLSRAGRFDDAIAGYRRELALIPEVHTTHYLMGAALLQKAKPARRLPNSNSSLEGGWRQIGLPLAWHALGDKGKADAALADLIANHASNSACNVAYVQAYLGNTRDLAFQWLDRAVVEKDPVGLRCRGALV